MDIEGTAQLKDHIGKVENINTNITKLKLAFAQCCLKLMILKVYLIDLENLKYRIAQNFNGGNFDVFDAFQLDCKNLTHHIV